MVGVAALLVIAVVGLIFGIRAITSGNAGRQDDHPVERR